MKNPLKTTMVALAALVASAAIVSAQEEPPAKVPTITVQKVDFKTVQMPNADPSYKWAQTMIDFKVDPTSDFAPGTFLNDVKMTLTLVYDKTATSLGGTRARGNRGKEEVNKASTEAGGTEATKLTSYRASVSFNALKVSDGKKQYAFYIPGEIVERDKEKMVGTAKPKYYFIEFEYDGMEIGAFDAQGKKRPNYVDSPTATGNYIIKQAADFETVRGWADAGVSETRGQLIPYHWVPGFGQLKIGVVPSVARPEIQQ